MLKPHTEAIATRAQQLKYTAVHSDLLSHRMRVSEDKCLIAAGHCFEAHTSLAQGEY